MEKVPVTQREFLSILWGEDNHGISELVIPESSGLKSIPFPYPSDLGELLECAGHEDGNYFGVCLRRESWPRKTGKTDPSTGQEIVEQKGTKQNVVSSMCVWANIVGAAPDHDKLLSEFPFKPSVVVRGGDEINAYWLLKEPAVSTDLLQVEKINKAISKYLKQENQEPYLSTTLRLPEAPSGTYKIFQWEPELRYSLTDFDILPLEETPAKNSTSKTTVTSREFLKAIWGNGPGVGEIRLIGKGKPHQEFFPWPASSEQVEKFSASKSGTTNVYFGVGLRKKESGKAEDVLSLGAAWVDIDFKNTPKEKAIELLKKFKLKASIGVLSGAGLHVYFLLKELATGDDLYRVKRINKALIEVLKGDPASHDIARILRVIGTLNVKYDPPIPCTIAPGVWRPDLRYNLSDFDFLFQSDGKDQKTEEPKQDQNVPAKCPVPLPEGSTYVAGSGGRPGDEFNKKASWEEILTAHDWRISHKEGKVVYWIRPGKSEGHSATTGYCGDLFYVFSSSASPFTSMAAYTKFSAYAVLNHGGDFSQAAADLSKQGYGEKKQREKEKVKPNFKVVKVVKFDCRPARYTVRVHHDCGQEYEVTCERDDFNEFWRFRKHFFGETPNRSLNMISQQLWEDLISPEKTEVEVRPAPEEASSNGAIKMELESFLDNKKEHPEPGELKNFAGYNETEVYFTLNAFRGHLKAAGIAKMTDREVIHVLKNDGWKDHQRRVGEKSRRLWIKETKNGTHEPKNNLIYALPSQNTFPDQQK